ncbi:methyl-accepting chemotaxis protein [Acidovorax sp. NCPPB 3859]|nr:MULTISPECIES: methyl-accepting chemotaxis protein [unclassified Acidovorax]MDA8462215.1 methyl-accepting chemotaxis protein [Acidovorax sp. GBBC 3333]MDA8472288.1 methyl-accepting chemotaxis protein [Acidovorax sp. GBBC 3299]WCM78333.1 methyl-accepting chemotaxis protein [Acidovorax sp. GBBC 712]WCM83227.1 methyl-accepting chemotaxis protein [Acidovorax sp. NCPPB 3859]
MKIATKMSLLLSALCLCMAAVGAIGMLGMRAAKDGLDTVYRDRVLPLQQLKLVSDAYAVDIVDTAHKVRDGALTPAQAEQSVLRARQRIREQWSAYLATKLVAEEEALVNAFAPRQTLADAAADRLLGLVRAGDLEGVRAFAARELYPAMDPLQEVLGKLIDLQLSETKRLYTTSEAAYARNLRFVLAIVALCMLCAAVAGYFITRGITRALGAEPDTAAEVAREVARGNLAAPILLAEGDSTSLMAQLHSMQHSLARMVRKVHQCSHGVASASTQISEGNTDLSSRTEQQASALQQTAASMEQLSSTVRQSADSLARANVFALQAASTAGDGGAVMQQVVRTMRDVDDSARKIAGIVSVIDGIAFQTNLLALNAAVEAARAGELGRGFAVVAGEVRGLAGRAADAAKQIKGLIDSSASHVQHGSDLVAKAEATMEQVVESVRRATALMGEVSAASGEQSLGTAQISDAVSQMDQVTQQNAAMVEEMAAASVSMSAQARELVDAVSHFHLPQGTPRSALA